MNAAEVKKILGLALHPCEGGWYVQAYKCDERIAAEAFVNQRYEGVRHTGTAIYYLLDGTRSARCIGTLGRNIPFLCG